MPLWELWLLRSSGNTTNRKISPIRKVKLPNHTNETKSSPMEESRTTRKFFQLILNGTFSLFGSSLTLALAIWAVYDYYQIREAKNTAHCRVSTIRQTLLADSILNFISFGISLFYCCIYSLETWFLENDNARESASLLGNNDNNNNNNNNNNDDEKKRSHPYSSLCTSCKGLLAAGSLIVLIYLTVATFYDAKCKSEAPFVYAFVQPYIIANFVLMFIGCLVALCLLVLLFASAIVLALFLRAKQSNHAL